MKELKSGVTLLVPAKNEESRLEAFLEQFKSHVDDIIVVENGSTDKTIEIARKFTDKVIVLETVKCIHNKKVWKREDAIKDHRCDVYNKGMEAVKTEWVLSADCDELWDEEFLKRLKEIIAKYPEAMCFRFPRCNLPDGKDYPDYQIRLVKTAWVFWMHTPHVIPFLRVEKREGGIYEGPLDASGAVETLDEYPIIHLPRRKNLRRPWWNEKW